MNDTNQLSKTYFTEEIKVMRISTKPAANITEANEWKEQSIMSVLQNDQNEEEKVNEKK